MSTNQVFAYENELHGRALHLIAYILKIYLNQFVQFWPFLPRDATLSAVYAVVVCRCVCLSLCVSVYHIPVLYQNG